MKIQPLTGVKADVIHGAFIEAFSDYVEPVDLSLAQLQYMLERRGFRDYLSLGAFSENRLIGFTLNGMGEWEGVLTAYDTGTAVQKTFRKQGIATRIFEESLPLLNSYGISRYLLEVIKTNEGAVDLYRKSGFTISREFDYWESATEPLNFRSVSLAEGMSIKPIEKPDWTRLMGFWDFQPSWQNSVDSVTRKRDNMAILGAFNQDAIVAYACMENGTGDVPQLAVHPEFRRQGLATILLARLVNLLDPPGLRVINTCADSVPVRSFLLNLGLRPGHGQYEMILDF